MHATADTLLLIYFVVDSEGVPLAVVMSAANVHDSRMMLETVDAVAPVRGKRGRPRRRPGKLKRSEL